MMAAADTSSRLLEAARMEEERQEEEEMRRRRKVGEDLNTIKEEQEIGEKEESEYELRWSDHNAQVISVFYQLSQSGEFSDVTISTEEQQFKAHKLVLSACSPYFRQLFAATPCEHPVVFLKDVPDHHMRLLLEYMYLGSISVRQADLEDILRTAGSLSIRGLTTAQVPPLLIDEPLTTAVVGGGSGGEDDPLIVDERPLIVDESAASNGVGGTGNTSGGDNFHHVETLSCHSAASGKSSAGAASRRGGAEGRKSSAPKKLRLSGDLVAAAMASGGNSLTSPRLWTANLLPEAATDLRVSPFTASSSGDHRSPEGGDEEHDDRMSLKIEDSIINDQPVDFSTTNNSGDDRRDRSSSGGGGKIDLAPQFSILGSYLKAGSGGGRASSTTPPHDGGSLAAYDARIRLGLAEDLRRAGYGGGGNGTNPWMSSLEQLSNLSGGLGGHRPASRDSRGDSREERNSSGEDNEKDTKVGPPSPLGTLPETLGIDIASRLRNHFMNPSYAWLNGGLGASLAASINPLSAAAAGSLSSLTNLAAAQQQQRPANEAGGGGGKRRGSVEKADKHPLGGIRTGEIGSNGKPAVECEVCGKRLADPSSLYRHRKIHSGDKPHKCPFCSRRFIQRYNMKQHVKTHKGALLDLENQSATNGTASSLIPQNLTVPQNLASLSPGLNITT